MIRAAGLMFAAALAGTLTATAPAHAASFDCGKARTADERAVCADPALSALDSEMGGLWFAYSRLPMLMGASGARRDDAQAFLAARGACGADAACIGRLYRARNAALRQQLAGALQDLARQVDADPTPSTAPAALPAPVAARIAGFSKECRDLGGEPAGTAAPHVASADLDRDGKPDYVIDTATLRCEGAATAYCANDGCSVPVALSSAGYAPLELRGGEPTLTLDYEGATLGLLVDRSNCPGTQPGEACLGTWTWNGTALAPRFAVRPR